MQLYIVGGAVRDRLLGEPVHDRDWVAVGATPQQLLSLGYKPVGKDFPVFLHPTTGEEVALARTERKSARGYHGFVFHAAPDVTLEQDLARRDLTINAMAEAPDGTLVDPFGGRRDLESGVLRHVSPAFAEDPVRLLRLARFAARWPHFTVAAGTAALLQQLVRVGEVDALVPERVWQELARGLMAARPSRMFQVLRDCGALTRLLAEPALDAAALARVDAAAANDASLAVRFALLGWPDGAAVTRACARLRASTEVRELAELVAREGAPLATWHMPAPPRAVDVEEVLALFERCDALRRPARFESLLEAAGWLAPAAGPRPTGAADPSAPGGAVVGKAAAGRSGREAREGLRQLLVAATTADTAAAASTAARMGARGPEIGKAVRQARLQAVRAAWPPA